MLHAQTLTGMALSLLFPVALTVLFLSLVALAEDNGVGACIESEEEQCSGGLTGSVALRLRASKDVWHRSQYYGSVQIGTPPKRFELMIDSGSFDISVQGHTCTSCRNGNSYGLCSDSDTANTCAENAEMEGRSVSGRHLLCNESNRCSNRADCNTKLAANSNDGGGAPDGGSGVKLPFCEYKVEFADHSTMQGRWMHDLLTLQDSHDPRRVIAAKQDFAELSQMGFVFKFGPFDGVIGLAPKTTSLQSLLHKQGEIAKKEYTLCFYRDGGYLVLGEIQPFILTGGRYGNYLQHVSHKPWEPDVVPNHQFGQFAWTPIVKDPHVRIFTHGIAVGKKQIMVSPSNYNDRVHTVLDSGSVLTYMEDTALEIVHNELKQQCQQGNNPVCENATAGSQGYPEACAYKTDPGGLGKGRCGATWQWWKKGPYKILCFAPEEGVDRRDHLKRMPWLHFVFLGVTVSVPPVQYLIEEYRIGKCVGLRSVGAGVKGLVLGSVMFNGLAIAHDFDEQRLGWAMSTCDHDPKPPSPLDDAESYSDWERRDPLEAGPDLVDSRPMVLQNRYFSNGKVEQIVDPCFGSAACSAKHVGVRSLVENPLAMPPDLKLDSVPNPTQFTQRADG